MADGTVTTWGYDAYGLGNIPAGLADVVQVAAGYDHSVALRSNGAVVAWGYNTSGQATVPAGLVGVVQVAAGAWHTLAVKASGVVVAWGNNQWGQLNVPAGLTNAVQVDAGYAHSVSMKADGTVVAWGDNVYGQASVPAGLVGVVQVAAGAEHSLALKSDGTVVAWGSNSHGQRNVPVGLSGVVEVAGGGKHSLALTADGRLVAWGSNAYGQSQVNAGVSRVTKLRAGDNATVGVLEDATVGYWGYLIGESYSPTGVVDVAGGGHHVLALKVNGQVDAWGWNEEGETSVPVGLVATQVAAGYYHSVALEPNGAIRMWGNNEYGQCNGPGLTGFAYVAAGGFHTIAVRNTGQVHAWGQNDDGQATVPAIALSGVTRVAGGYTHTLALKSNGSVVAWGAGGPGVPQGEWPHFGQSDVPPGAASGVVQIGAGAAHSVALKADGSVLAWGADYHGQTSVPPGLPPVTQIAAGGDHTVVLLPAAASGCSNPGGAGTATLSVSGSAWENVGIWSWSNGGGPQVPGALTDVDLGTWGSVGSLCDAQCSTLTAHSGSTLIVKADLSVPGGSQPDHSIDVFDTASLAGRVWLVGFGVTELPADLDIPVLRCGSTSGSIDILQTNIPAPAGKFLALVPSVPLGGSLTTYSLRLLDLSGDASLTEGSAGGLSGEVVAAEAMDWDGDGFDDLALAISFGAGTPGTLQVLLNDGAGNLGSISVQVATASEPTCLAVGDMDGDGSVDALVGAKGNAVVRVFLNNHPSTSPPFSQGVQMNSGSTPLSVAYLPPVATLDGPGSPGAMTGDGGGDGGSGPKATTFSPGGTPSGSTPLPGNPGAMAGVGRKIITGGANETTLGGSLTPGKLMVIDVGADGTPSLTQAIDVPGVPVAIDIADIDGDGHDDVLSANAAPVQPATGSALPVLTLFRGSSAGLGTDVLCAAVPIAPQGASAGVDVSLIDADGDGDRDIVSVQSGFAAQRAAVLMRVDTAGPGQPLAIGAQTDLGATAPVRCTRGDLDGQGGEDLFLVDAGAPGLKGGAASIAIPFLGDPGANDPCPADINDDGLVDGFDLTQVLTQWGQSGSADVTGDGTVGSEDLASVLSEWGACAGQ